MSSPLNATALERIARNLERVRERIAGAASRAGRSGGEVTLVAVTKSVGIAEVRALYDLGLRHFGENRPELAHDKISAVPGDAVWHAIGNLQRRKARVAVEHFACIDAVDRIELAETLQAQARELQRRPRVLVELNLSGEASKHGFGAPELNEVLTGMRRMDALNVEGLMTMAPFGAPENALRPLFAELKALAQRHGLKTISMGMTDDFEIAIEEGATEVRIGRALFE